MQEPFVEAIVHGAPGRSPTWQVGLALRSVAGSTAAEPRSNHLLVHLEAAEGRDRARNFTASVQPAWLARADLCSCLGHLQNGCEVMNDCLLVFALHEPIHRAPGMLKQIKILSPEVRVVTNVMKLIANSQSVAEVAPTEMALAAEPDKLALLKGQCDRTLKCTNSQSCAWLKPPQQATRMSTMTQLASKILRSCSTRSMVIVKCKAAASDV